MADYKKALVILNLAETFSLKEKQKEVLDLMISGKREVIAILPTGYGKSLIYQMLPTILDGSIIVFSPLSAIMEEQNNYLHSTQLKSCILNTKVSRSLL